jgi:hypothetical protein
VDAARRDSGIHVVWWHLLSLVRTNACAITGSDITKPTVANAKCTAAISSYVEL